MNKFLAFLLSFNTLSVFAQFSHENVSNFSNWENQKTILFKFDGNQNKVVSEFKSWNLEKQEWLSAQKDRMEYDENGQATFTVQELFDGHQYQPKGVIETDFEMEGSIKEKTTFYLDAEKGEKIRGIKVLVNKLENGVVQTETLYYNPKTGDWGEAALVEDTFDSEGEMMYSISKRWNAKTADWENFKRTQVSFNDNKTEKEVINELWNRDKKDWSKKKTKGVISWNNQKSAVTYQINSEWNYETKKWFETGNSTVFPLGENKEFSEGLALNRKTNKLEKSSRVFYYYDDLGRIAEVVYQKWDLGTNDYLNTSRTLYKRDVEGLIIQEIYQKALPLDSNFEIADAKCEFANPYPIGGNINCDFVENTDETTIQLMDTKGTIVHLDNIGGTQFSIDKNLPSGNYFLVIRKGDKIVNQEKLLIQRD